MSDDIAEDATAKEVTAQNMGSPVQFFDQDSNTDKVHFSKDKEIVTSKKSVSDFYRHPSHRKDGGHHDFAATPAEDSVADLTLVTEPVQPAKPAAKK